MTTNLDTLSIEDADHEKQKVALSSVGAAVLLTTMKIIVGIATGSLGILSEAAHSGLDLIAAIVTYFAVRISGKPADERLTYGYGKVENLSALFETLLLLLTCVWIIYEAIQRLFFKHVEVEASFWAFLIMVISIIVDIGRSKALSRAAKKYDSQALEADALHFSTDIWSSSVVIVGLILVVLSKWLDIAWLAKADAVAAIGVAGIVIFVSIELGHRTILALLDAVPPGLREEIFHAVLLPGVQQVDQVRVRKSGPDVFTDIILSVGPDTPLEQAYDIANRVEEKVQQIIPSADVLIHLAPKTSRQTSLHREIRRIAEKQGLRAHSIRIIENGNQGKILDLHIEVNEYLRLDEAHDQANRFENALRQVDTGFERITTHIEPFGKTSTKRTGSVGNDIVILGTIKNLIDELGLHCHPHNVHVSRVDNEMSVSFHCHFDGNIPINEAHRQTEQLERLLRNQIPEIGRVIIHTEPKRSSLPVDDT